MPAKSKTSTSPKNVVKRKTANDGVRKPSQKKKAKVLKAASNNSGEKHSFDGFLFDLDGTLIDTTEAITKHWKKIGAELNLDPTHILNTSRGRRSIDTLNLLSPEKATWEYVRNVESQIPSLYGSTVRETPGSSDLLRSLSASTAPWAIVTSCTRTLLTVWVDLLSLPAPPFSVAAEDVETGKPDPACYALGCERLGVKERSRVLVVEDSPSGVMAGKKAGCKVLALTTTHGVDRLRAAGADWIVGDLEGVKFLGREADGFAVEVRERRLRGR